MKCPGRIGILSLTLFLWGAGLAGEAYAAQLADCKSVLQTNSKSFSSYPRVIHNDREIPVRSRTQAEKIFKLEQESFEKAAPEALVPYEIIASPFYFPFWHTSLRIGNSVYEFTNLGWEIHGGGFDSARAFLYNNPFFRNQYKKTGDKIPFFSLGVQLHAPKANLQNFIQDVVQNPKEFGRFNMLKNNCNHCLTRTLADHGIDLLKDLDSDYMSRTLTSLLVRSLILQGENPPVTAYPAVGAADIVGWDPTSLSQLNPAHGKKDELIRLLPFLWDLVRGRSEMVNELLNREKSRGHQ